jgi:hypothetical protein
LGKLLPVIALESNERLLAEMNEALKVACPLLPCCDAAALLPSRAAAVSGT